MKLYSTELVREIFLDNRKLCLEIEEQQVRRFARLIEKNGLFPRYLELLQVIMLCQFQWACRFHVHILGEGFGGMEG